MAGSMPSPLRILQLRSRYGHTALQREMSIGLNIARRALRATCGGCLVEQRP